MAQALTNKKFIEQMDDVIEELGGTPTNLQLTADKEDDMLSNGAFAAKMDEVVEALGGTPAELTISDDEADDMVSDHIFQLKMEDVVKNMSGGGGGSSDFSTADITITFTNESGYQPITAPFLNDDCTATDTGLGESFHSGDTATLVLYKGKALIWSVDPVTDTSGDIEYDSDTGFYIVTGDCSITTEYAVVQ